MKKDNIRINGDVGTWYIIDEKEYKDKTLYLLEHEDFGDEAGCLIIDKNYNVVMDDVWNGFDDYDYLED